MSRDFYRMPGSLAKLNDVKRLREQAAKARRLSAGVNDRISQNALNHYADECDEHADRLELVEEARKREMGG